MFVTCSNLARLYCVLKFGTFSEQPVRFVEGYIDGIVVNYGGAGFELNGDITVSGISPFALDLAVDGVDTTGFANLCANS